MSLSYLHIKKRIEEYTKGTVYPFYIPEVEKPPYVFFEFRDEPVLSKDQTTQDTEIYDITFCHKSLFEAVKMAVGFRTYNDTYAGTEKEVTFKNMFFISRQIPTQTGPYSKVVYKITDSYQIRV